MLQRFLMLQLFYFSSVFAHLSQDRCYGTEFIFCEMSGYELKSAYKSEEIPGQNKEICVQRCEADHQCSMSSFLTQVSHIVEGL